ncbi:MAG TPA: RsmD family RNA methyltransferase [Acidimicrobiales bacterium]|jgi:16S rRNA (guanine966-N2)-methyltransferase
MRVVAGSVGGRRLVTPPGSRTRPTSELVRAAIFNSLESRGLVRDAIVADLFAGSGALGIEALSRGAAHAHFVESAPAGVRIIRANLDTLGLAAVATVERTMVERWSPPPAVGLVLADPPYEWNGWEELLGALATFPAITVVAESDREVRSDGWRVLSSQRHGGTVVSQLQPRGAIRT